MKIYLGFLVFFMNASYIVMLYSYAVGKPLEFLLLNATTMIFSYISYNILKEEK